MDVLHGQVTELEQALLAEEEEIIAEAVAHTRMHEAEMRVGG